MTTLALEGLTKRYRAETVLDGISLGLDSGETVAVFGPSGGGKTVLLRLIAGVEEPSDGTIRIGGADMTYVAPERRGVGMAFQNFALFPHMSAYDNIASPLLARRSSPDAVRSAVHGVARLLKIEHVLDHAPRALSNGQKQRTALARALAARPEILLLDDPLRNVDAKLRFEMRLELPRLLRQEGATVLYVTQDYKEAMALGDRIAVLDGGRFVQVGTPAEIYLRPATVAVARLFGDPTINILAARPEADGDGPFATIAGARIALPDGAGSALGRDCMLGIRPESVQLGGEGGQGVELAVEAVTPLNEKVVTLMAGEGGLEVLASRPSHEAPPRAGERVRARIPREAILLFDRASGAHIAGGAA